MKAVMSILMILGVSFSANAADNIKEVTCYSKAKFKDARKIKFEDILNEDDLVEPYVVGLDGGVREWFFENGEIYIQFSNECDNNFGFEFSEKGLRALAQGRVKKIKAKMSYYQVHGSDHSDDTPIIEENDVTLTCYKSK